ncbi:MAG: FAD-binding oxidoreductase [Candidatus Dormibacteria bacterium]
MSGLQPLLWNGWGAPQEHVELTGPFRTWLAEALSIEPTNVPTHASVREGDITLPPSRISASICTALSKAGNPAEDITAPHQRLMHAAGRSYTDLLRLRENSALAFPDAVVAPTSENGVIEVLRIARDEGIAVIPFGGGTSVVGGVEPASGSLPYVIAVDTRHLHAITDLSEMNSRVTIGGGARLMAAEDWCREHGYIIGHYPQSYEFVTVGGCAATRSAGQSSEGYGRFDDMVLGLTCITPEGRLEMLPHPDVSVGPDLRELVLGSEGTLGIITSVTLRVHPKPRTTRYEGWMFPTFEDGVSALRYLMQARGSCTVARLSDEEETAGLMRMGMHGSLAEKMFSWYLGARGYRDGVLAIVGWEELSSEEINLKSSHTASLFRDHHAIRVGEQIGRSWERSRYFSPYVRDVLMDMGVMVETFETAASWSDLIAIRDGIRALAQSMWCSEGGAVGCHVSHMYSWGASLYFTVLGRRAGTTTNDAIEQWKRGKEAIMDYLLKMGSPPSHHHGIGVDHLQWMGQEVGKVGAQALKALKSACDPTGIMNPGKLVQEVSS